MPRKSVESWTKKGGLALALAPSPQVDARGRLLPEVLILDDDFPSWIVQLRVDFDGAAASFHLVPRLGEENSRLTARALRAMPLHRYCQAAWRYARAEIDRFRPDPDTEPDRAVEYDALMTHVDLKKPGRKGRPDVEYARVAGRYEWFCYESGSATPLKDLAEELHLSDSQVRGVLGEARRRRLLTDPPTKGVAGGHLTEKAKRLLATKEAL